MSIFRTMKKRLIVFYVFLLSVISISAIADFDSALQMYHRGDHENAYKEWRKLAEEGDPKSQYEVGLMYETGQVVQKDYNEAIKWYRLSSDKNVGAAQNNLGLMYIEGRGVSKNEKAAVKLFYRAGENGSLAGIFHLALCFEKGVGIPQDYKMSALVYLEAAERGYAPAQANVGLLYAKGVSGVPQDYTLAYKWLSLAVKNLEGDTKTKMQRSLNKVSKNLTPNELEKMNKVIKEWKPFVENDKKTVSMPIKSPE